MPRSDLYRRTPHVARPSSRSRWARLAYLGVYLGSLAFIAPMDSFAQQAPGFNTQFKVMDIRVEGTSYIDRETVISYLGVKQGDTVDGLRLNAGLKALYASGLFRNVRLHRDGDVLVVEIAENPIINRVEIEGNDEISDSLLKPELSLAPNSVLTRTQVQEDTRRLVELYQRSGFYLVEVRPRMIERTNNRVDLVFEVNEGEKSFIRSIRFIGNQSFSDAELHKAISSAEYRWWRLAASDTYDADRIAQDRELLRDFYLSKGFADFDLVSSVSELSPDSRNFFITFTIEEGARYRIGDISITSSIPEVRTEELQSLTEISRGDWYNAAEIEETSQQIVSKLNEIGFAFAKANHRLHRKSDRTVHVEFQISETAKVFVNHIRIQGNERTEDRVIRREFRLVEGDALNIALLQRSRQRIQNLGFFSKVDMATRKTEKPDRVDVEVNVAEQPTGEVSLGLGYSTFDGPQGTFSITERNLLGRAHNVRLSYRGSGRSQDVNLSFTEPYFLDYELSAGIDLFNRIQDNQEESSYNVRHTGGRVRLSYEWAEHLSQFLRYALRETAITDVDDDASAAIREQAAIGGGSALVSEIGQTIIYDRRDNRFRPRNGYFVSLSTDYNITLDSDLSALNGRLHGGYYTSPFSSSYWRQFTLRVLGDFGKIFPIESERVRLADRFYQTGLPMRGFRYTGISPRDLDTGDALGGINYFATTTQANFSLGLPEDIGLTGQVFFDAGSIWDASTVTNARNFDDSFYLRAAIGFGFSWNTVIGPIAVDYGIPIRKKAHDREQRLRFSFGTTF